MSDITTEVGTYARKAEQRLTALIDQDCIRDYRTADRAVAIAQVWATLEMAAAQHQMAAAVREQNELLRTRAEKSSQES